MTAAALTPGRRTRSSSTTSDGTESQRGREDHKPNDEIDKKTTEKSKKKSKKSKKQKHLDDDDDENVTPRREQPSPVIGMDETTADRHIVPATPSSTTKHGGSRHHHKDDSKDDGNASGKDVKKENKKKKKSKKGKRHRDDDEDDDKDHDEAERTERVDRKENDDEDGDDEDDVNDDINDASSLSASSKKKGKKKEKKSRDERKREQEELLSKIPTVDEDGISYTKLQIRRMIKRVKRGLPPVLTPEEENARLRNEAALRREEEAELAGMGVYRKTDPNVEGHGEEDGDRDEDGNGDDVNVEVEGDQGGASEHDNDDDDGDDDDGDMDGVSPDNAGDGSKTSTPSNRQVGGPAVKKAKRNKPVPPDYVCMACQNKHGPRHWIYDCPDKVTVKGANQKKKRDRGIHDPDSRKVFVSGLPFEVKAKDVETFFDDFPGLGGKVTMCRLVKFGDTGRCNGQAYVSFDSDGAAERALQLSGTVIDASKMGGDHKVKETKGQSSSKSKRTDLKLKVSRVLNRIKTRKGNGPKISSGGQPGHRD